MQGRGTSKTYFSGKSLHWALKMPVLVQFAIAFLKTISPFPIDVSQGWLAFWTDLCRQNAHVFDILCSAGSLLSFSGNATGSPFKLSGGERSHISDLQWVRKLHCSDFSRAEKCAVLHLPVAAVAAAAAAVAGGAAGVSALLRCGVAAGVSTLLCCWWGCSWGDG